MREVTQRSLGWALIASSVTAAVSLCMLGMYKVVTFEAFSGIVKAHGVFPTTWTKWAAIGAVVAELACGLGLIVGLLFQPRRLTIAWGFVCMLCVTMLSYAVSVWRHPPPKPVPCGCRLSALPVLDWKEVVTRDAVFVVVALSCLALSYWYAGARKPKV